MNTAAVTALLAGKEPVRALVLASEKEVAELADVGLPVNPVDSILSMQHLASAKFAAECMLGKGGHITAVIPASLAYGVKGAGQQIGPNATLVFDIKVRDINPAKKALRIR